MTNRHERNKKGRKGKVNDKGREERGREGMKMRIKMDSERVEEGKDKREHEQEQEQENL
jgi:hypothetical protein